jgi:hypothetical protein
VTARSDEVVRTGLALLLPLALAAPFLLSVSFSPSATLVNQLLAVCGWGAVLLLAGRESLRPALGALAALEGVMLVLLAAVLASAGAALPLSLAVSASLLLCGSLAVLFAAQQGGGEGFLVRPALLGVVVAGVLSGLVAVVQVFFPESADRLWIAHSSLPGRAVGNMRQPNHRNLVAPRRTQYQISHAHRRRGGPTYVCVSC